MSTDTFLIRRRNLRALIDQYEGAKNLAKSLGYTSASYLSQMIGPHPTRQVTEKVARQIERRLTLPAGWLDKEQKSYETKVNEEEVGQIVMLVSQQLDEAKANATPKQFATLVALVHEKGGMDENYLRRLITLLKR